MPQGSISICAPNGSIDLRELADWLRGDDIFHGKIRYDEKPIEPGEMGGMIEAIVIAVGGGGAANTLIRHFFTWLGKRGEGHTAQLTLKDGTGREASLNVNGLSDSEAIINRAFEFFSADDGPE